MISQKLKMSEEQRFLIISTAYNHGQNFADKLIKSSNIGVSMKCFTVHFLQDFSVTIKIWFSGGQLGTCYQFKLFQYFLKFLNFLRSKVLTDLASYEATCTFFF